MITSHPTEFQESIPFEQIGKDWTFVKLPTQKIYLGMRIIVKDVTLFTDKDGKPHLHKSGQPSINLIQVVDSKYFTYEEAQKTIDEQNRKYYK